MIAAIDPGIGLKEDKPMLPVERSGNTGFSTELRRYSGNRGSTFDKPRHLKPDTSDPRARAQYGRMREEGRRTEREKDASGEKVIGSDKPGVEEAAQTGAGTFVQPSQPVEDPPLPASEEMAASVLTPVPAEDGEAQLMVTPDTRPPIDAQIGLAAYRLGEHTPGEAGAAQAAGTLLPNAQAKGLPQAAPSTAQLLALQPAQPEAEGPPGVGQTLDVKDVLELKSAPLKGDESGKKALQEGLEQSTAQVRNELLNTVGHATQATDPRLAATLLPRHGLPEEVRPGGTELKDIHSHIGEVKPTGEAPPQVGLMAPAGGIHQAALARSDMDQAGAGMVDKVVQEARWLLTHGRNEVTFKLHPEHLGQLHLKVVQKEGVVRVDMTVDTLSAKHLLESNLGHLREQLLAGHQGAGEFLFNVDVRKGNDSHPEAYARMMPAGGLDGSRGGQDAVDAVAGKSLSRPVWGNHSVSIYA